MYVCIYCIECSFHGGNWTELKLAELHPVMLYMCIYFGIQHPGYDSHMGKSGMGIRQEAYQARMTSVSAEKPSLNDANHLAATDLRNMLRKEPPSQSSSFKSMKRPPSGQGQGGSDSEEEPEDNVK